MIFVVKNWKKICTNLADAGRVSVPLKERLEEKGSEGFLTLKHDVETNVPKAHRLAKIETELGHRGSYYVQAYLLEKEENVKLLQEMQDMGHEITYHHDVMDSNKGNLEDALAEFEEKVKLFQDKGFSVISVCQHGNPVVERVGYTSNRDFFRSDSVQERFSYMADIMVDFPRKAQVTYDYYSDAGRKFKLIFDPINNDVVDSEDKNVAFDDGTQLTEQIIKSGNSAIISIHPHRWESNGFVAIGKEYLFKGIKKVVKLLIKIPIVKKIAGRYYYLAKKI